MSRSRDDHLSPDVFKALLSISNRVYENDLGKRQACAQFITKYRDAIDAEEFPVGHPNPYANLAETIQRDWPEIWNDRGEEVLRPYLQ